MAMSAACSAATYSERFSFAIQREYKPLRHATKLLARKAAGSECAAKRWLSGEHTPRLENLVVLLANCDALHAEFLKLVEEARGK